VGRNPKLESNRTQLITGSPVNPIHSSKVDRAWPFVIDEFCMLFAEMATTANYARACFRNAKRLTLIAKTFC
jgi:hypothetical protein